MQVSKITSFVEVSITTSKNAYLTYLYFDNLKLGNEAAIIREKDSKEPTEAEMASQNEPCSD